MFNWIREFTRKGVREENRFELNSRIQIQNIFALASTVFAFPFIVGSMYREQYFISSIFIVIQIGLIASIALNAKGKYRISKVFLIGLIATALPTLNYFYGLACGFYLYYSISPIIILYLYDLKNVKRIAIVGLIMLGSIGLSAYFKYANLKSGHEFTSDSTQIIYAMNVTIATVILSFLIFSLINYYNRLLENYALTNQKLKRNVAQKEVLISEVHHRVKNNMAIISGLFRLQMKTVKNQEALEIIRKN